MKKEFDREKFKDAMHYVAWRAGARPGFGATKLYKVLWFSDARSFVLTGEPITGAEYVRRQHGPVPKAALPILSELESERRLAVWEDRYINKPIKRFKALKPASTQRFTAKELQTIDWWIKHIDEDHTATSISDESHDYGWEIAQMGETLPLHAFLSSRIRDPNPEELEWARQRAKDLGLH